MNIAEWLVSSMVKLKKAGVDAPRTDCLVFLCDALGKEKSWIHAHPEYQVPDDQLEKLNSWLIRREKREPLAYIRGKIEFYGRDFTVNKNVLIPRPESEDFIEILKSLALNNPKIADIGTGSGCLGITAALELPGAKVDLYDISEDTLAVVASNVRDHKVAIDYYQADLLENLREAYDILLANLPYVPEGLITSPEITKEPGLALFFGKDGLGHYRRFWEQLAAITTKPPHYILTEALENQHSNLERRAKKSGYTFVKTTGLIQLFKK
jgi:release factor glutamine methyltransferase